MAVGMLTKMLPCKYNYVKHPYQNAPRNVLLLHFPCLVDDCYFYMGRILHELVVSKVILIN